MKYFSIVLFLFYVIPIFPQNTLSENELKTIYFKAERQKLSKNYEEAIVLCTKVIDNGKSKYLSYSYMGRGTAYTSLKKNEIGIEDFTKSIEVNSNNFKAYSQRAYEYLKLKKYSLASEDAIASINLNNTYPYSYFHLGRAYFKTERYELAEKAFSYAISNLESPNNKKYRNFDLDVMYYNRGIVRVLKTNSNVDGCSDLAKANELGYKKAKSVQETHCQ